MLFRSKKYREISKVVNEEAKALARDVLIKPFEGLARLLPDGNVTSYPDPNQGKSLDNWLWVYWPRHPAGNYLDNEAV